MSGTTHAHEGEAARVGNTGLGPSSATGRTTTARGNDRDDGHRAPLVTHLTPHLGKRSGGASESESGEDGAGFHRTRFVRRAWVPYDQTRKFQASAAAFASRGDRRDSLRSTPGPNVVEAPSMSREERPERPRRKPVRRNKQKKVDEAPKAKAFDPTTGKALRMLRGLGHELDPVLNVGKDGITDGVIAACLAVLGTHELVKVKVLAEAPADRKDIAAELAEKTSSTLAQVLGRTFLLYKRNPKKPRIRLEE